MTVFFKAMGLMLLPHNAPDAAKNVAYMVDEIWYHAGDTSTDVCSKIFCTCIGLYKLVGNKLVGDSL